MSPVGARPSFSGAQDHFASNPPAFPGVMSPTPALESRLSRVPGDGNLVDAPPPGLAREEELTINEINLLVKFLNAMGDLPRIEIGDAHGRGERLKMWQVAMETQLKTTRRVVLEWWK